MRESHYPTVRPAADIMDAEGGVQIVANMPGVREEDLYLALDGRELRIRASSHCPSPEAGSKDLRNLEFGNVEYELDIAMDAPLSAAGESGQSALRMTQRSKAFRKLSGSRVMIRASSPSE